MMILKGFYRNSIGNAIVILKGSLLRIDEESMGVIRNSIGILKRFYQCFYKDSANKPLGCKGLYKEFN